MSSVNVVTEPYTEYIFQILMKIKHFKGKNGRTWYFGKGTHDEVDRLNEEKDFDTALDVLQAIRKTHNYLFDGYESPVMDRSVYGTRKDTGRRL